MHVIKKDKKETSEPRFLFIWMLVKQGCTLSRASMIRNLFHVKYYLCPLSVSNGQIRAIIRVNIACFYLYFVKNIVTRKPHADMEVYIVFTTFPSGMQWPFVPVQSLYLFINDNKFHFRHFFNGIF